MKIIIVALTFLALTTLPAPAADKVLNGGDACERRFLEVRDDLTSWMARGGHESLRLPAGLSAPKYRDRMQAELARAQVSCTQERLFRGRSEKTCLNFLSPRGESRIRCQSELYLSLSQDEQYRLTHHEYAGLAGLEANAGDESHYELSNQIAGYLDTTALKRLSVRDEVSGKERILRNFADFLGDYAVLKCSLAESRPLEKGGEPNLCLLSKLRLKEEKNARGGSLVMMFFLEKSPDMFGDALNFASSNCQLSYGSSLCEMRFNNRAVVNFNTRIEKLGDTYLLDVASENSTEFRKWSLVLKSLK